MVLVLQQFAGSGILGEKTTTVTATSPLTVTNLRDEVVSAYAYHLLVLESRNLSTLLSGYEGNATLLWTGVWDRTNITGQRQIGIKLEVFVNQFGNSLSPTWNNPGTFSLSNVTMTVRIEKSFWVVDSAFNFSGANPLQGGINGSVIAQDSYVNVGGTWLISRETWNFAQYHTQFIIQPT